MSFLERELQYFGKMGSEPLRLIAPAGIELVTACLESERTNLSGNLRSIKNFIIDITTLNVVNMYYVIMY